MCNVPTQCHATREGRDGGQRPQAGAVQNACNLPGDQDTRGQKGREGVGGLPRTLLCTVHAGGIEGGRGQRDKRPETLQPGTRGRAR